MKWADFVLRLLLRPRDRDTISGDLLEAYREEVLPRKGPVAARLWYVRQAMSLVSPAAWGIAIGAIVGVFNLIDAAIEPLADDTGPATAAMFAGLLALWTLTAFGAARRTARFLDALAAGVFVAVATTGVMHAAAIVRVNVFLDEIRHRDDWQFLLARFHASGFESLRWYANYEYVRQIPFVVALAAIAGAVSGTVAGAVDRTMRIGRPSSPS